MVALEADVLVPALLSAIVSALEVATALIILFGAARAVWSLIDRRGRAHHRVRQDFGRSLLLALDFAIGSDVIRVALTPTFEGAATAGLVVLTRVILTFVLERELKQEREHEERRAASP
jgi:uncharacterized membrane protein